LVWVAVWIRIAVRANAANQPTFAIDEGSNIWNPRRVPLDSRIADFETCMLGVKGNPDSDPLVVLRQHRVSQHCRHEGCDALLPVDENFLAFRACPIFQPDSGI